MSLTRRRQRKEESKVGTSLETKFSSDSNESLEQNASIRKPRFEQASRRGFVRTPSMFVVGTTRYPKPIRQVLVQEQG